jgi:phospholipid/cholesterol/gamma-HCH transport system ATP-binding protein
MPWESDTGPFPEDGRPLIEVQALTMAYGERIVQENVTFSVRAGEIFIIMGGSGCGKSTLLRHMIGLVPPAAGTIRYRGRDLWKATASERLRLTTRFGVLFQGGALWSAMTLEENVALPLRLNMDLPERRIREASAVKLALVGLGGFGGYYPSEISGGMRKRAALARAIVADPDVLFCDEPGAGLDPVNASRLDELILELRASMGTTVVMVTHELASIFAVGDSAVFLDAESKTAIARGAPRELCRSAPHPRVSDFLNRRGGLGTAPRPPEDGCGPPAPGPCGQEGGD